MKSYRLAILALSAIALAGCAENKPAPKVVYLDSSASTSALAFDPPVIVGEPLVDLDRSLLEPSAFVGYEGPSITTYWIHTDDEMESGYYGFGGRGLRDWYSRRTIMDKFGSLTR